MSEVNRINLSAFLGDDAQLLVRAREEANRIHGSGDIRTAVH